MLSSEIRQVFADQRVDRGIPLGGVTANSRQHVVVTLSVMFFIYTVYV